MIWLLLNLTACADGAPADENGKFAISAPADLEEVSPEEGDPATEIPPESAPVETDEGPVILIGDAPLDVGGLSDVEIALIAGAISEQRPTPPNTATRLADEVLAATTNGGILLAIFLWFRRAVWPALKPVLEQWVQDRENGPTIDALTAELTTAKDIAERNRQRADAAEAETREVRERLKRTLSTATSNPTTPEKPRQTVGGFAEIGAAAWLGD